MKWFWSWYLRRNGWVIEGDIRRDIPKMIIIVAPHTSWLDFIIGLAVRSVKGMDYVRFMGKAELFKPPFGFIFRWLGGTPVDRTGSHNLVDAVVYTFRQSEKLVIAIAPEGTRKRVEKLKSGFYHIARLANIPITMSALDFANRRVIFSEPFYPTGDEDADFETIYRFYAQVEGKHPEQGLMHILSDDKSNH